MPSLASAGGRLAKLRAAGRSRQALSARLAASSTRPAAPVLPASGADGAPLRSPLQRNRGPVSRDCSASDEAPSTSGTSFMPLGPSSLHLAIAAACFAALSTTQSAAAAQLDPTTAHALLLNPHFDVAENADFWGNVVRYGRFFVTVMLGTGTIMLRPLAAAFKNPLSAIAAIGGVAGLFFLVQLTLKLMLGIETPEDATLYGF